MNVVGVKIRADVMDDGSGVYGIAATSRARAAEPVANEALWLRSKRAGLAVGPAPYTPPRENEIVVRNRVVAINPIDWLTQSLGDVIFPWTRYPFVLGSDVAGDMVQVGAGVSRFTVGDRVLGHAVGADKTRNRSAEGAFQHYTVLLAHMAAPIPDAMPYERAAVLPLALSTAACGLFERDHLALHHPMAEPVPRGKTVLVWGGSTSVGGNAIQLAVAAGYDVIATASPGNFNYVASLGATRVFDYRSRTVVADIVRAMAGRSLAGAIAIGLGSATPCLDIVHACEGDKVVSTASTPVSLDGAPTGAGRPLWLVRTLAAMLAANVAFMVRARLRGIRTKFIFGTTLLANEVGPMIYQKFLPDALADGRYRATPDPLVAGRGLDRIPAAMETQKHGVSARKVVVVL